MSVRFGVLGPVHISDSTGSHCCPGAYKVRVLLALLLTDCNRVVSAERLMDELWEGSPPRSARTATQVYVSALRKTILAADPSRRIAAIVTRPPGYMIELDEEHFDLSLFRRISHEAERAEQRDDPVAAARLVSRALALWRGPSLHDVRFIPSLEAEARRLDEMRMAATERRIQIDLRLGLARDLIGELYALTARHPLREKLCEYLMVALHEQGRPSDALIAYETLRVALREQLGLEPGPELKRLQSLILCRDLAASSALALPLSRRPPSRR